MAELLENFHQVSSGNRKKKNASIRTIKINEAVKASYDVESKLILFYLFDKGKYTIKDAKQWVKQNKEADVHTSLVNIDHATYNYNKMWDTIKQDVMAEALNTATILK